MIQNKSEVQMKNLSHISNTIKNIPLGTIMEDDELKSSMIADL